MALATLTIVGCEKDDDNYSTDYSGMWGLVAEHGLKFGTETYDLIFEVLSFENGRIKCYDTRSYEGYELKNGYLNCSRNDLVSPTTYTIELHKDKCYVDDDGFIQIKGNTLYWYYDDDKQDYDVYERIKGFTED